MRNVSICGAAETLLIDKKCLKTHCKPILAQLTKLGCKIIHGPYIDNFKEIYKKLNSMNISTKFKSYNHGTKIIEKKLNKKMLNFYDKKIITYGDKVLNLTYSEITRLI